MKFTIAWLALRIVYAWMFLYPLRTLLKDFEPTVQLVALVVPFKPRLAAIVMVLVMIFGALMILFGIYAELAGFMLCVYCLIGMVVHYKLSVQCTSAHLSAAANEGDIATLTRIGQLGAVGHITSMQKNAVLAAVGFFFMLVGSGPMSIS